MANPKPSKPRPATKEKPPGRKPVTRVSKSAPSATAATDDRAPGRPRSEASHAAILTAAAELLETEDYHKITIERIASLAKVGKPTIYRWWPSKADVVLEAYREEGRRRLPAVTQSEDALADLKTFLKRLLRAHRSRTHGRGLRALIAEAQVDSDFREKFFQVFHSARRDMLRDIVEHGISSGQFRPGTKPDVVLDIVFGAFWYRLLSGTGAPLNDTFADDVIAMLAPGLLAEQKH